MYHILRSNTKLLPDFFGRFLSAASGAAKKEHLPNAWRCSLAVGAVRGLTVRTAAQPPHSAWLRRLK